MEGMEEGREEVGGEDEKEDEDHSEGDFRSKFEPSETVIALLPLLSSISNNATDIQLGNCSLRLQQIWACG